MIDGLLRMSAVGAVVICAVLLLRLFLRRAPKIFSYALWLIVLFRLLCPVSVALPVSVFNLLPEQAQSGAPADIESQLPRRQHPENGQALLTEEGAPTAGMTCVGATVVEETPVSAHSFSEDTADVLRIAGISVRRGWRLYAGAVWLAGVLVMLAYACRSSVRLHKTLKGAGLDRDNIYLLEDITSPFVAGVLRPRIYLPCGLEERERSYILLHEQTHIRRGDPFWRVLAYVALTVHWFNPFVWAAFFLSGRDMEMSCDETVLRRLGEKIKCDYSDSLLRTAQGNGLESGIPLAFGEGDTGKRIKNVLNYQKTTIRVVVVGALVVLFALAALGADPVEKADADSGAVVGDGVAVEDADTNDGAVAEDGAAVYDGAAVEDGTAAEDADDTQTSTADGQTAADKGEAPTMEPYQADVENAGDHEQTAERAQITTVSVRSVSRSARCIDRYVTPDEAWEDTYGSELFFAEDCKFYINSSRNTMNPGEVTFSEFAEAVEAGDHMQNKPCVVEIHENDKLIHEITLVSARYGNGVSYVPLVYDDVDSSHRIMAEYDAGEFKKQESVRTETMDLAAAGGDETIEIHHYKDRKDGCEAGIVHFFDSAKKPLYSFAVDNTGMCRKNIYVGRMDGAGDPYILELYLENRDTSGEYSYYVYTLGYGNDERIQIAGSRIEWKKDGSLIYDPHEMAIFFHELGHYLSGSHLLVGVEDGKIRTQPVCDEDHYTYANCAPSCFPDPYEGLDVR